MTTTLEQEGILGRNLVKIDGDLVKNYNSCLKEVVGKETALTSFRIDKRGESPEIEDELGKNYLQNSSSHRHLIIVTPEQQSAELLHEEFSFDTPLIDKIYEHHLPAISAVTRVDGLASEMDDKISTYESLEDLILIKNISVELHTPSGFITAAKKLKEDIRQLKNNPALLIDNDSALVKEIYALAQEIGDVREYAIEKMSISFPVSSFYSRLFDGVYIFREDGEKRDIKRPTRNIRKRLENLKLMTKGYSEVYESLLDNTSDLKTFVIYNPKKNGTMESGPNVKFIPRNNPEDIALFLLSKEFVAYDADKADQQIARLEDLHMLAGGYDVASLSAEERSRSLDACKNLKTPYGRLRDDLKKFKRQLGKGFAVEEIINNLEWENRFALMNVTTNDLLFNKMTNHLLATLVPGSYEATLQFNQRHLENTFKNAAPHEQQYISKLLREIDNKKIDYKK